MALIETPDDYHYQFGRSNLEILAPVRFLIFILYIFLDSVLSRVQAFLPAMAKADADLQLNNTAGQLDIENTEDTQGPLIEMVWKMISHLAVIKMI